MHTTCKGLINRLKINNSQTSQHYIPSFPCSLCSHILICASKYLNFTDSQQREQMKDLRSRGLSPKCTLCIDLYLVTLMNMNTLPNSELATTDEWVEWVTASLLPQLFKLSSVGLSYAKEACHKQAHVNLYPLQLKSCTFLKSRALKTWTTPFTVA